MTDQAEGLRELIRNSKKVERKKNNNYNDSNGARFVCVTSGKGGVGKTNFTVNLAIQLADFGKKVVVIDADLGLSNVDVVMGLMMRYNLLDLLQSKVTIDDVIMKGPAGISVISGGSGVLNLVDLSEKEIQMLISCFRELYNRYDYVLIDTGAGINRSVLSFVEAANETIVVMTPDPTSITDAYALVKNIADMDKNISVVINRAESNVEGTNVFDKFQSACVRFLNVKVNKLGVILDDSVVGKSVKSQQPFIIKFPNSIAAKSLKLIANKIDNGDEANKSESGFGLFIKKLFKGF